MQEKTPSHSEERAMVLSLRGADEINLILPPSGNEPAGDETQVSTEEDKPKDDPPKKP